MFQPGPNLLYSRAVMSDHSPFPDPPRIPSGLTVTAIGDVHGHLDLLTPYLHEIEARAARRSQRRHVALFLGDLIDRGPDSAGVLERLTRGVAGCELIALKGNHEEALLEFLSGAPGGRYWLGFGGAETLLSYGIDCSQMAPGGIHALRETVQAKLPEKHLAFVRGMPLHVTFGDYFFVHAGIRPGRPLDEQIDQDMIWIRDDFLNSRMRFEKKIVHGHTPVVRPDFRDNRINLDTGAYATGRLTAAVFEDEHVTLI
jgi:serine/threonine protein phosphatase 1